MNHSENTAEFLHIIIDDITDGDNNFNRALKAANDAGLRNIYLHDVGAGLADADIVDAEAAGKRMIGETEGKAS